MLFGEGQRRYLESLNAYARQFVQPAARPDVDAIFGIPPTVAIEQRTSRGGRKSTVATLTEVYHFLRLLYVKLGMQYCPDCDVPIEPQSFDAIAGAHPARVPRPAHRPAGAAGGQPQGRVHRPGQMGARQGLLRTCASTASSCRPRKWPRLDRFASTHIELPVADLRRAAARRSAAARRAAPGAGPRQGRGRGRCGPRRAEGRQRRGEATGKGAALRPRLLDQARLPVVRHQFRRARPAPVLVQLASTAGARHCYGTGLKRCRRSDARADPARKSGGPTPWVRDGDDALPGLRRPAAEPRPRWRCGCAD